jgi:hypothetical protein
VPGPHRTRVSNKSSRANRERCVARRAPDGLGGPRWGRTRRNLGDSKGQQETTNLEVSSGFAATHLGSEIPGLRFHTAEVTGSIPVTPTSTNGFPGPWWDGCCQQIASRPPTCRTDPALAGRHPHRRDCWRGTAKRSSALVAQSARRSRTVYSAIQTPCPGPE